MNVSKMSEKERIHLIIKGRVQGVGFRYWCREMAQQLGVTGWVRNLFNGDVEVVAEGSSEQLNELLKWCRKGPPYAFVKDVTVSYEPATDEFSDFDITY